MTEYLQSLIAFLHHVDRNLPLTPIEGFMAQK